MGLFGKRKPLTQELPERVVRRAKVIPTGDLIDWAENTLYTAHRSLSAYRAHPDHPDAHLHFAESLQNLEASVAILRETRDRGGIDDTLAPKPKNPVRPSERI